MKIKPETDSGTDASGKLDYRIYPVGNPPQSLSYNYVYNYPLEPGQPQGHKSSPLPPPVHMHNANAQPMPQIVHLEQSKKGKLNPSTSCVFIVIFSLLFSGGVIFLVFYYAINR
ncbi:hypothetical protein AX774_g7700 [Zancudomyces culisetae]|uniref:Uncharacterized protein n=1 Tax=Zancudomyces culisetae TaxID=1213189 RepID=A0A1R1PD99_ZANCU|nr:hypothetical protein AX774_g7700 [Zancudomyces culisetae]|eukprot:OMH78903.1 hypothetical protein AX774_g7700 [Zancudomyces culisetae]